MKKKPHVLLSLLALLLALPFAAQGLPIHREDPPESIVDVVPMPGGGFLLIGTTSLHADSRPLARKMDGEGRMLWETALESNGQTSIFVAASVLMDGRIRLSRYGFDGMETMSHSIVTLLPDGTWESETDLPAWQMHVALVKDNIYAVGTLEDGAAVGRLAASGDIFWMWDGKEADASLLHTSPAGDGLLVYGSDLKAPDGIYQLIHIGEDGGTRLSYQPEDAGKTIHKARLLPDGRIIGVGTRNVDWLTGNFAFCIDADGVLRFEETVEVEPFAYLHDMYPLEEGFLAVGTLNVFAADSPAEHTYVPIAVRIDANGIMHSSGLIEGGYSYYMFIDRAGDLPAVFGQLLTTPGFEPMRKWGIVPFDAVLWP